MYLRWKPFAVRASCWCVWCPIQSACTCRRSRHAAITAWTLSPDATIAICMMNSTMGPALSMRLDYPKALHLLPEVLLSFARMNIYHSRCLAWMTTPVRALSLVRSTYCHCCFRFEFSRWLCMCFGHVTMLHEPERQRICAEVINLSTLSGLRRTAALGSIRDIRAAS